MMISKSGPEGNAFFIMGTVKKYLREIGEGDQVKEVLDRMTSGDYENLCEIATEVTHGAIEFVD